MSLSSASGMSRAGSDSSSESDPKFTRGEKCIFTHLVITFSLILFFIIVYFIHLCAVNHTLRDVWKVTRRTTAKADGAVRAGRAMPVGAVYLGEAEGGARRARLACGALLLRARWSAAPAHCAAARTDPDMAPLLHSWHVRYQAPVGEPLKSGVKRSIPHPHFDRDDFRNNVGLLEHEQDIATIEPHVVAGGDALALTDASLRTHAAHARLVGWAPAARAATADAGSDDVPVMLEEYVQTVPIKKCARFMAPVLELRTYEFCILLDKNQAPFPEHGSVFAVDDKILGFFAWGEKSGKGTPGIVLELRHYKDWLENIMAWAQ